MKVGDLVWVIVWEELALVTESDSQAGLYTVMYLSGEFDEMWDYEMEAV